MTAVLADGDALRPRSRGSAVSSCPRPSRRPPRPPIPPRPQRRDPRDASGRGPDHAPHRAGRRRQGRSSARHAPAPERRRRPGPRRPANAARGRDRRDEPVARPLVQREPLPDPAGRRARRASATAWSTRAARSSPPRGASSSRAASPARSRSPTTTPAQLGSTRSPSTRSTSPPARSAPCTDTRATSPSSPASGTASSSSTASPGVGRHRPRGPRRRRGAGDRPVDPAVRSGFLDRRRGGRARVPGAARDRPWYVGHRSARSRPWQARPARGEREPAPRPVRLAGRRARVHARARHRLIRRRRARHGPQPARPRHRRHPGRLAGRGVGGGAAHEPVRVRRPFAIRVESGEVATIPAPPGARIAVAGFTAAKEEP